MERRSQEQIRRHYEIEKEIADRLRSASAANRRILYTESYDELFRRVTDHPMLAPLSEDEKRAMVEKDLARLRPMVNSETVYLEIGPGDCTLAFEVAKLVKRVIAVDVSNEITKNVVCPDNFTLILSDGTDVGVEDESVDLVFSNQLMEHIHPDDLSKQLKNVADCLCEGGCYFCITPNRLSGPHDISRTFDPVATGLHIREYTNGEVADLLNEAGFEKAKVHAGFWNLRLPVWPYRILEALLEILPHRLRKALTFNKVVRFLLGVKMIGIKQKH